MPKTKHGGGQRFKSHFKFGITALEPGPLAQEHSGFLHGLADRPYLGQTAAVLGHACQVEAFEFKQRLGDRPALVFFADPHVQRHFHVIEKHLVEEVPAMDANDRAQRDAWGGHVDEQKADAFLLRTCFGVGTHETEDPVGVVRARCPDLAAVDYIVLTAIGRAFAHCAGLE